MLGNNVVLSLEGHQKMSPSLISFTAGNMDNYMDSKSIVLFVSVGLTGAELGRVKLGAQCTSAGCCRAGGRLSLLLPVAQQDVVPVNSMYEGGSAHRFSARVPLPVRLLSISEPISTSRSRLQSLDSLWPNMVKPARS